MRKVLTTLALALYTFMMVVRPWIVIIHGTAINDHIAVLGPFGLNTNLIGLELIVNTLHIIATIVLLKSSIRAMLVGVPVTAKHKRSTLYTWKNEFGTELQGHLKATPQPDEILAYSLGYKIVPMKRIGQDMIVLIYYLLLAQLINIITINL